MRLPTIPRNMANQSVALHLKTGAIDDWGKPETKDINIEHCVVQPQTIYSGSNNDRTIVANAVVFFYAGITEPMPVMNRKHIGSELTFEDQNYVIQKVIDNRDPYGNTVWSYELEVL